MGYLFSLWIYKLEENNSFSKNFKNFDEFTAKKLNIKLNGRGWVGMILEDCGNDEMKAFEKFYKIFEEYVK